MPSTAKRSSITARPTAFAVPLHSARLCLLVAGAAFLIVGRILVFVESWASEEAWRAHMPDTAIKRYQTSGMPNLLADFHLHALVPVAAGRTEAVA